MYQTIKLSKQDAIATISFSRPDKMNTLNKIMADELYDCTEKLRHDPSIKVVVLKGEGKLFMAGGDVQFFYENLNTADKEVVSLIKPVHQVIQNLRHMPQIVIASAHGSVAGVGLSFMMASDLAIAAQHTKFTLAYTRLGTTADGGATYFLPRLLGLKKAMEMALLSEIIQADEAKTLGLINFLVPEDELVSATGKLALKIIKGPSLALAGMKHLLNDSFNHTLAQQLNLEQEYFTKSFATQDFKEGVNAFINKKIPQFSGE